MTNMGNIFEAYYYVRQKVLDNPYDYSSSEYLKILQSVKTYFDSFVWVSNDMDRLIYLYAGKGLNNTTIADYIGVNVNTYRSRVSRVSNKLAGVLFDGRKLEDACLYASVEEIADTRAYIEKLNHRLVLGRELSNYMFEKIHNITEDCDKEEELTEENKFRALMLVAHFSEPAIDSMFSDVKPEALAYIMNELYGTQFSEWSIYYKRMQKKVSHVSASMNKLIDFCKTE